MYKNFLVPVDGSAQSKKAAAKAVNLAEKLGVEVTLLHVMPQVAMLSPYAHRTTDTLKSLTKEFEEAGTKLLNDIQNEHADSGVKIITKLIQGDPAVEITEEAEKGNYDMIIIAHKGLGEVKKFLMGSVSSKVVKHAKCAVVVVK